ncbi:MAG: hypothetical protein KIS78_21070 [Labilithrix sp.]|nr:hypothetical protein [Labilithrix sp.]MCW5834906.1 hypothetical protein [Labilithrix sp.]
MKTPSLLSLSSALVLGSMLASIGCSTPVLQPFEEEYYEDEDDSSSASSKKKKTSTNQTTSEDTTSGNTDTTPPPADTTPPPDETPTDPMECFDQCAASGPAAQYWSCSETCQNQQCDDNCWFQSCGGAQEQACMDALDACDAQCGNPFGQGGGF